MFPTVGIVIPTFQGAKHLPCCLPPLLNSPLKPRVLVIDSSSTDGTASLAAAMGAEVIMISQNEFNHGTTREKGRLHLNTDIIVMITQDAYATSTQMIKALINPLVEKKASLSYGRQLPYQNADIFASFARDFNYPSESHIRSIEDLKKYGSYTFFCSNSCAAYLNSALDEIGGIPDVLFGEDTVCTAKLLARKHRIAYVAEAEVYHSHNYSLIQEFKRHFDIGLSRSFLEKFIDFAQEDQKRGGEYVKKLFYTIIKNYPQFIPYAFLQTLVKFSGYRLGKLSVNAPIWLKKMCSSQKFYWNKKSTYS